MLKIRQFQNFNPNLENSNIFQHIFGIMTKFGNVRKHSTNPKRFYDI